MKKTLIAVAVFGAYAGIASAQSSVTLYGVGDAVMERVEGAGTMHRISSGGLNGSRFGLRGVEDLGGGLKAVFQFESGFGIDDGTQLQGIAAASATNVFVPLTQTTSTTRLFGRQAFVGLQTGFGTVRLGRQYTPAGVIADAKIGNKTFDVLTVAGSIFGGSVYTAGPSYRSGGGVAYAHDRRAKRERGDATGDFQRICAKTAFAVVIGGQLGEAEVVAARHQPGATLLVASGQIVDVSKLGISDIDVNRTSGVTSTHAVVLTPLGALTVGTVQAVGILR